MSRARDFADLAGSADAGGLTGRNLIINGAMTVAQRGTSGTGLNGYISIDRFRTTLAAAFDELALTHEQSTDAPTGFSNSYKITVSTPETALAADELLRLEQRFEGQNLQHLKKGTSNAEAVTLSFWVKGSVTGTYIVNIFDQDNTRAIAKSYTINSANTWEYKTITFAGDTTGALDSDNAHSLTVAWNLAAGTDRTSGTLATSWEANTAANLAVGQTDIVTTSGATFYITGVQLEVGETATPFEHEDYGTTLRKCQRYFAVLQDTTAAYAGGFGFCNSTTKTKVCFPLGVSLRANPTVNVTAATIDIRQNGINTAASSVSNAIAKGTYLYLDVNAASGLSNNHACAIDPKQNMTFDAEL